MAEDPNFKIALEAVLRDRDDLYRRLMQAERKLKEMSDLQAMNTKPGCQRKTKSLKLRIKPLNPRTIVLHRWNVNWSIFRGKSGEQCLKRENSLMTQTN